MILTGPEIERRVAAGSIEITPYDAKQVNPASYDLRLGTKWAYYEHRFPADALLWSQRHPLDTRRDNPVHEETLLHGDRLILEPDQLYLLHTEEIVCAHDTVPIVDGKSSLGRLGISVHQTAGFGDLGFRGQYTLEVTVVHPVIVYAGMRFCQIRFHEVRGEIRTYNGQYQGETAMGPQPSRSWKQFEGDK